jgi:hypothetical protein
VIFPSITAQDAQFATAEELPIPQRRDYEPNELPDCSTPHFDNIGM